MSNNYEPYKVTDENVLVVGMGKTGLSVAKFLTKRGAKVTATDLSLSIDLMEEFKKLPLEIEAGSHRLKSFLDADLIIVSPGVPPYTEELVKATENGVTVIGDMEFAASFIKAPIIAITGTNGKSTVTTLIGKVLEGAGKKVFVGGNLGVTAIECVDLESSGKVLDYCVLEVSSYNLELTNHFRAHIAVLLNITEDHLARYKDFQEYGDTKMKIFSNQGAEDFAVFNLGDAVVEGLVEKNVLCGRSVPFTGSGALTEGFYLKGSKVVRASGDKMDTYSLAGFKLMGKHNKENAMAVMIAAELCGVPLIETVETIEEFEGLEHRMEVTRDINGVTFINDSKGTNVGALKKALEGLDGEIVLIAGGVDKGGNYDVLQDLVSEKVKFMILMGESKDKIKQSLGKYTTCYEVDNLEDAVKVGAAQAKGGDTVLFSPACSSFDMFKNFEERGRKFKEAVRSL